LRNQVLTQFDIYKMEYKGGSVRSHLSPVLLTDEYFEQYQDIVDKAFNLMRQELEIRPYDKHRYTLMDLEDLKQKCHIVLDGDIIICGVTCNNNEIDSVVVNPRYQGRGMGRKITEFGVSALQKQDSDKITLSVTKWNTRAVTLYQSMGFEITRKTTVTGVNILNPDGSWSFMFTSNAADIMR